MKIVSTDQSTTKTGLAVIEDGRPVYFTLYDHSGNNDKADRIKLMFLDIIGEVERQSPGYLVFEAVQQQKSPQASMMLSALQGGLICYAYEHKLNVSSPLSTEWREVLGFRQGPKIKREELKAQAKDFVLNHFGITASEDECEAICIGIAEYLRLNDIDVMKLAFHPI